MVIWHFALFYILVCASFFFVLISNFASIQLTVFMINIILLSILLRWQVVLIMIVAGVILTGEGLKIYLGKNIFAMQWQDVQFKIGYLLLLMSGILVAFLKPKQEAQDLIEIKDAFLAEEIQQRTDELSRSLALKHEFINNISHEVRAPLMGITSLGKGIYSIYKKLTPQELDKSLKAIADSSERLESLMNNILDFSKLSSFKYSLNHKPINLSELLYQCIEICSKLYLNKKELEFIISIPDNIIFDGDEYYLRSCLDNLIINAIKYSEAGKITISLKKKSNEITLKIQDQGIGVPEGELQSIFAPFAESSRTRTAAGGRGIGLALCKKAVELHGGKIWATNNKEGGATFWLTLPVNISNTISQIKQYNERGAKCIL